MEEAKARLEGAWLVPHDALRPRLLAPPPAPTHAATATEPAGVRLDVCGQSSRGGLIYRAECRGLPAVVKPLRLAPVAASASLVLRGAGDGFGGESGAERPAVAGEEQAAAAALLRQALAMAEGGGGRSPVNGNRGEYIGAGLQVAEERRLGGAGTSVWQWLEREVEAAVRVRHPGLCAVLGAWQEPGVQVLAACVSVCVRLFCAADPCCLSPACSVREFVVGRNLLAARAATATQPSRATSCMV